MGREESSGMFPGVRRLAQQWQVGSAAHDKRARACTQTADATLARRWNTTLMGSNCRKSTPGLNIYSIPSLVTLNMQFRFMEEINLHVFLLSESFSGLSLYQESRGTSARNNLERKKDLNLHTWLCFSSDLFFSFLWELSIINAWFKVAWNI